MGRDQKKEKYREINKKILWTYLAVLVSIQVVGILVLIGSKLSFGLLLIAGMLLGILLPLALGFATLMIVKMKYRDV